MEINIRKAVRKDCARILELVQQLAANEGVPNEVRTSAEQIEESGFGDHPLWYASVAEVNSIVHGFALWYPRFSTWKGPCMYLEDFYVTEDLRGKGIGKLLFESLLAECRIRGYVGLTWQVSEKNEKGIRFYQKFNAGIGRLERLNCDLLFETKKSQQ